MAGLLDFLSGSGGGDPSQGQAGMGLMNLYANPQLAGMLGMSQGLLSASGPSRLPVSMGQALGAGVGGMQQGAGNALQMQMQMARMQAMMNPFGPPPGGQGAPGQPQQPQQPQQPNPAMAQGAPVSGGPNVGPMSGLSAGMGGLMQPQPQGGQPQAAGAPTATDPFSAMFGGHTPQEVMIAGARAAALGNPAGPKMMEMAAQYDPSLQSMMPTDITKMGTQAGFTPQQLQAANAGGVAKATYIAPVRAAPGGALAMPDGSMRYTLPAPQAGGMWATNPDGSLIRDQSGQPFQIGVGGASNIAGGMAAAQEGGKGSVLPFPTGLDRSGNPLPLTNRTQAATGQMPGGTPTLSGIFTQQESSGGRTAPNNPLQIQQGTFNQYAQPSESWNNVGDRNTVAQRVLTGYNQKYGGDLGRIATAYFSGEGNVAPSGAPTPFIKNTADANGKTVASYVGDILGRAGGSGFGGSAPATGQGAPIYGAAPLGATNAANTSQGAPSQQMANAYGSLSTADANYQQSRAALTEMMTLANNKGAVGSALGVLPESVSTRVSPDAATYQKAHATFVALQGKALGSGGTDAARATLDEAVPMYDKPQSAMVTGLTNQLQNLDLNHIKTQFLTPVYQQGNEKTFTQQSAAFDNNVTPQMTPVLTMQPGPQRAQALQQMIKADPSIKPKLDWAVQNGILR